MQGFPFIGFTILCLKYSSCTDMLKAQYNQTCCNISIYIVEEHGNKGLSK